jgi:hypothetical protein
MSMASTNQILNHAAAQGATPWSQLPETLRTRLAAYGVHCAADWRKLSPRKRGQFFGITTPMVIMINTICGVWSS